MIQTKEYGLTALDIAGRINAQDAIDEYLEYFLEQRHVLQKLFQKNFDANKNNQIENTIQI